MVNSIHRQRRKIPSLKKHGLSAVLLLALIALSSYSWLNFSEKRGNTNAYSGREITLPVKHNDRNDTQTTPLPDLLEEDGIPMDANPTETLDLLGAPTQQETKPTPAQKSATQKPISGSKRPSGNIPQTILIDGKPININVQHVSDFSPLTRAPIQGLTRMSPFGRVPYLAPDGRTALNSYAKPFSPAPNTTYISIVIGGLGMNAALTKRAINELPSEVSLAFAAKAPSLQSWIHQARAKGHEVLIELPMQGSTAKLSAIHTLTAANTGSRNIKNLDFLLSRAEGYFAVTNYDGEILVKDEKTLKPILVHIKNAGLGFIYDGATAGAVISSASQTAGLPMVTANQLIDENTQDRANVKLAISSLHTPTNQTVPIGMGFSFGGTIDGVKDWVANKPEAIDIAPVSYALKTNIK